ncbi:MAG: DUF2304 domain-containing protein [Patescibacteria group bacterium]
MSIFQVLIFLVILYIIIKSFYRFTKKEITFWLFLVWLVIWLAVLAVNFFPMSVTWLANFVGIGRGVDLMTYCALIIVFWLLFKAHVRIKNLEKKFSRLVSRLALKEKQKK